MEANFLLWIQENLRNPVLDVFFKIVTHIGEPISIVLIAVLLIALPWTRKFGSKCVAALLVDLVSVNIVIKNVVRRIRPYDAIEGLTRIIEKQSEYSFPSGHAAACFTIATVAVLTLPKKYSVPIVILAALIAFSRLYVGVHYPSDVLAGIVIGVLCGFAGVALQKWIAKKIQQRKNKKAA